MSEEGTGTAAQEADRLANLQAEFSRKQENTHAELSAIKQQLAEAVSRLPKPAPAPEPDDTDLMFSNPNAYKQKLESQITERVSARVNETLESRSRAENERISTLQSLASDYPELNKADTSLYQETVKILNSMPEGKRGTAEAYRLAVYQAAANEGIKPASKRGAEANSAIDNFSFNGKKSSPTQKKSAKDDLDPKVLQWAELLGIDTADEKEVEDLKKYAKRDFRSPQ